MWWKQRVFGAIDSPHIHRQGAAVGAWGDENGFDVDATDIELAPGPDRVGGCRRYPVES